MLHTLDLFSLQPTKQYALSLTGESISWFDETCPSKDLISCGYVGIIVGFSTTKTHAWFYFKKTRLAQEYIDNLYFPVFFISQCTL